ncbi:MAG: type II toxin-antitoxin system RelB/DinJ family antitoxin [Neisseria sp.]|nr:type II toxin-antitoxin system RelB/DinJ family antitoxin [Neisseria sp.]
MSSINFNVRMDESLKERAFPIIESYGLTPAQAVKLFLNQVANTRMIPLSFDYKAPNKVTQQAMQELVTNRQSNTLKQYDSLEEMMADIQADQA